ncbi:MAG: cofactor assembly of complex C subunit B [Spirulinaceae cyanobacterium SM2_1_0]|nr:cofactor assembly of complex C subunit B [Spirulinaceae cyanobacterium SM2_1_0]
MTNFVLPSTFFLTVLLAIGLFFFIRASTKDRIEELELLSKLPQTSLLEHLQTYFDSRAYKLVKTDSATNQVTFEGYVRPSWFLAIFLSSLTACGCLCLGLVLTYAYPVAGNLPLGLILLSPLAGYFYWQGAGRTEQVVLRVEEVEQEGAEPQQRAIAIAHRDELAQLRRSLAGIAAPQT